MKGRPTQTAEWSHLDGHGAVRMVGVGHKPVQERRAVAVSRLLCRGATIAALKARALPKGDVLTVAQIAGIQAVKRCAELIPLCHPLPISGVDLQFELDEAASAVEISATARVMLAPSSAKRGSSVSRWTPASVSSFARWRRRCSDSNSFSRPSQGRGRPSFWSRAPRKGTPTAPARKRPVRYAPPTSRASSFRRWTWPRLKAP